MIFYVTVGGMKGTTWVQIVKAVLLMSGTVLITVLVLAEFNFNLSDLLGAAADNTGKGEAFLEPGPAYGVDLTSKIDFLSLGLALVLGTAGLPHILIRFYTVPTAKDARKSVLWAIGLIGVVLPDDAGAGLRCRGAARHGPGERGRDLGRQPGLTAARRGRRRRRGLDRRRRAAGADLGGGVRDDPRGRRRADADLRVVGGARHLRRPSSRRARRPRRTRSGSRGSAAFVIGGIAIALAIPAQKLNIAFLVALAFAVAASANLPSIIYNLFWRRFNTRGAVWAIYGGLISCVGLVFFSPVGGSGTPTVAVHRPATARGSR